MAQLATCSYAGYDPPMGVGVRITLGIPYRWPPPPGRHRWPYLAELAPKRDYFRAPPEEFAARYFSQLDRLADGIETKLGWIPTEDGRLVLLCFERSVGQDYRPGPGGCHRRLFAQWWRDRTGEHVPELDPRSNQPKEGTR